MLALAGGGSDAFAPLFARYRRPVYAFFRRRLTDTGHAEELTQETFLALLHAAPRYKPLGSFRSYLYGIAFTLLRAHRRKAALRATFFLDRETVPEPAACGAIEISLAVREALAQVESTSREVLLLREYEQLSYAEIAALLDLPVNTVRSRLFRARNALHAILAAEPGAAAHARPGAKESE